MRAAAALVAIGVASCNGCSKEQAPSALATDGGAAMIAEPLPRCRADGAQVALPGEDVLVGDVAIGPAGIAVGVVRRDGAKHVASVVRAPLDLGAVRVIDVGPARGDDPPPSPRWNGDKAFVAFYTKTADAGWTRELRIARMEEGSVGETIASVVQQHDESLAFDLAWGEGGSALVAWDEDAPPKEDGGAQKGIDRGFVKVRSLGEGGRTRVASPESSDAEMPRLLPRPGGFWLGWLAKKTEETQGSYDEGPGEKRAYRWVEVVALDARGEPTSPVRRVSPEKGRAVAFELASNDDGRLVVLVQDEAAPGEGAGGRIVRHVALDERIESEDLVDAGVGQAIAELAPVASASDGRWLAWHDGSDRVHLLPLAGKLTAASPSSPEPALDGARVIGAASSDHLYAIVSKPPAMELRRFACARR